MAKTILRHLYDGEINPSEIIGMSNEELLAIYAKIGDAKAALYEKLTHCALEELEHIDELADKAQSIHGRKCFMYGFKLGAILIMEVLSNKDDLVHENHK